MNLQGKIWLSALAAIFSIMAVDLVLGYRNIEHEVREQLGEQARIVRAMLMATRRVYHEQFLASGLPVNDRTVGFLPAHAVSRISAQFPQWLDTGLRFNNVSDRPRNPANQADEPELRAIDWFRRNPKASERIAEFADNHGRLYYHFAAPIWIEAYCLQCHGRREDAPESIRQRYAGSYGYQLGELRGVMSIRLPLDQMKAQARERWRQEYGLRAVGYLLLLLLLGLLVQRLVLRPIRSLREATLRLGGGDLAARAPPRGNDEIAQLADAFNDMAGAIAEHDAQVARLNRIYAALSETNQTIVRVDNEAELFRRVCQIAVELGGMKMAWIARRDADGCFVPQESFGVGLAYLAGLRVDPRQPAEAAGPIATAWRSARPAIVQDYFADERTLPWHERARRFEWGSSAAFPIRRGREITYTLNLYHAERLAFDDKMRDLLAEMAADIGYALDRIDLVAERLDALARLSASESKFRNVLATSHDGFWLVDHTGRLVEVNDAYVSFSGYGREELLAMSIADLEAAESPEEIQRHIAAVLRDGHDSFETRHRTRLGEIKPVQISTSVVSAREGLLSAFIHDLSNRTEAEQRIQRLSHFDTLTGLPNRVLFDDVAQKAIGQAARNGESLALCYIDIDHFKNINDTLGHRIGDQLLIELTERFRAVLRSEDTLSRQGGDEFLLLLPHAGAEDAAHVAERLMAASAQPLRIGGHELPATPSIGIALYPSDGADFESLLQAADTATNQAKQEGRNTYRFFAPEMQRRSARTLQLEASLRRALEHDELLLHYQPQVDLADGRVVGMEALIRWRHPELGMISPVEFIPIAETSGLILPIGEWVIRQALARLKALRAQGLVVDQVAVNLSAVQFRQRDLPERVAGLLAEAGLPASSLELELTEGLALENPDGAIAMMDALHAQGIKLSIDDFGTGYSSLNYLKRFRIDKLKIDQSFVRDLTHDPQGEAIVQAIVKLASTLGFRTIAEGVETVEQLRFLRACDCQEVQGYYFSRPLPPVELEAWLRDWAPARAGA